MTAKPLDRLKKWLENNPLVQLAIVYGSFAKGQEKAESDLDLAVAGKNALSEDEKISLLNEANQLMGREVDLVDLNVASGTVAKEALQTGRCIVRKDAVLLARIISRIATDEEDFQKTRRRLMAERRKKVFHDK